MNKKELLRKQTNLVLELENLDSNVCKEMVCVVFYEYIKLSVLKLDKKDQEIIAAISYVKKYQPELASDTETIMEVIFRFKNHMNGMFNEPYNKKEEDEYIRSYIKLRKIEKRAIIQNLLLDEEYSNEDISKITDIHILEVAEIVDDLNKESAFLNELEGV